jgi:DNA-binding transcriptional MocR family regulator
VRNGSGNAVAPPTIAVSYTLMNDDSSVVRLVNRLRTEATSGQPGDQLPSTRSLVTTYRVSPVTVSRALARLTAEGIVVAEPGRGTFIAPRQAAATVEDVGWQTMALCDARISSTALHVLTSQPDPSCLRLLGGYLTEDLQPTGFLAAAGARASRRHGAWSQPAPVAGLPELRASFAAPVGAEPDDVIIVPGGQSGISTAMRALTSPGQPVLVESPTYVRAIAAARVADLRPVAVPTDAHGIRPDLLAEAFARTGARLVYLQPTYANPTGAVLAAERRSQVLEAARAAGAFILEDDWARQLGLTRGTPPPLIRDDTDGHVVYLTSLSKPAAPNLRIAALVARGPAALRLTATRAVEDLFVARPLQEVAVELLEAPAWARHLTALRGALRERRDVLVAAVREHLPGVTLTRVPDGGFFLWLRLPRGSDDLEFAARAGRRDVAVGAGRPCFVTEPPGCYLRLSYCGATPAELTEGVRRLAELF